MAVPEPSPLWLVGGPPANRWGNVAHAGGALPVVMWQPPVYPDHVALEAHEFLGLLGAGVGGVALMAGELGIDIPMGLARWGADREVPAEAIGPGTPTLLQVNGLRCLCLEWRFEGVVVVAAVIPDGYVFVLHDGASPLVELMTVELADPAQGGP